MKKIFQTYKFFCCNFKLRFLKDGIVSKEIGECGL